MIAIFQNMRYKFHVFIGLKGAWIMLVIVNRIKRIVSSKSTSNSTFNTKPCTFCVVISKIFIGAFGMVHSIAALAYNKLMMAQQFSLTPWTSLPIYIKINGGHLVKMLPLRSLPMALS